MRILPVLATALVVCLAVVPAHASVLINGDFENGLTGWNVGGCQACTGINTATDGSGTHSGTKAFDFGAFRGPTTLEQGFSDVAGQTLTISWFEENHSGKAPNCYSLQFDGNLVFGPVRDCSTPHGYILESVNVLGTGSDSIQFNGEDAQAWLALDDVSIDPASIGAPEVDPASGLLPLALVVGVGLVALDRRRPEDPTQ